MNFLLRALPCIGLILRNAATSADTPPAGPEDLVSAFASAWNHHDPAAFKCLFTEDADWVTTYDTRNDGREKVFADLQAAHTTWAKDTSVVVSKTAVKLLRPDVAIVHFNADVTAPGVADSVGRTLILVALKQNHTWKITSGQIAKPNCQEQ